ncbi:ParB-like nuclease domain containing protein [Methanonatronarchaeum thermophilum]|uniref:ParB-like nuclease domain containing protein n=1 Tax=Methanonatronarchaeum thermophilum TaxID=1927129 RepID=A0A1Y3GCZ2_9EURY|nr:hypothetical protein [Methanonatronarchaeum thermophilum]OUJ18064.1 ParB-like nuclease domain containing protein [Methanonatronarchaeum thermophilum]
MIKKCLYSFSHNLDSSLNKIILEQGLKHSFLHLTNKIGLKKLNDYYIQKKCQFPENPDINDLKMVEINPNDVNYYYLFSFPVTGKEAVIGEGTGDWDKQKVPLEKCILYRSIRERFLDGKDWPETEIYRKSIRRINNGLRGWNTRSKKTIEQINRKCEKIDLVYRQIRDKGYKSQEELFYLENNKNIKSHTKSVRDFRVPSEIGVSVGRNGELIQTRDGRNRLSLLKVISEKDDIEFKVPAILYLSHKNFNGQIKGKNLDLSHPLVALK